ncbi:hypothetical protein CJ030_MR1G014165 [Morella rubra]|uniref:Uncharacterized protein n=1 Tax=Morella rubra TaxID=262757 RepID=A0A6A1WRQ8_9ROSI|nr:hypothetical protein CJ030_MR1G014165 [Morella rubra]
MDSQEGSSSKTEKKGLLSVLLRCSLALIFPMICFFALSFLLCFVAVSFANSSISNPISLPSQCKIVSSGE